MGSLEFEKSSLVKWLIRFLTKNFLFWLSLLFTLKEMELKIFLVIRLPAHKNETLGAHRLENFGSGREKGNPESGEL